MNVNTVFESTTSQLGLLVAIASAVFGAMWRFQKFWLERDDVNRALETAHLRADRDRLERLLAESYTENARLRAELTGQPSTGRASTGRASSHPPDPPAT